VTGTIRSHALDGSGEGTVTERRWDAEGAVRWSCGWASVGGAAGSARYVLVHSRGQRPMRGGRGWHSGHRGHGHGGVWLPLVLLVLFISFTGFWALFMLLFAALVVATVALGAYAVGTLIGGVFRVLMPGSVGAGKRRMPPPEAPLRIPAPAPYRLSGGTLAATGGPDLYRKRLLEVLQERYVRGEIALSEFEARAGLIARDPSARHLS
jgi:hypothetical protein